MRNGKEYTVVFDSKEDVVTPLPEHVEIEMVVVASHSYVQIPIVGKIQHMHHACMHA